MPRLHAFVHGHVQGVFFRAFVEQTANKLNLAGWVRNREDGSVEVVAEGTRIVLEGFLEALKKGPSTARVERVDAEWQKERGEKGFEVRC